MTSKVNYGYFSGVGSGIAGNVLRIYAVQPKTLFETQKLKL